MENLNTQSLVEHLMDLKRCLVRSLWIILIGFAACFYFSSQIFEFIRHPILPYLPDGGLVFTHPTEKFLAYIKVSLLTSVVMTCPLWLYQVWLFVAPGLYKHERRLALKFIFFGSILFLSGVAFVYRIIFPLAFKYLLTFGNSIDKPMITISEYLSFFIRTTIMFGLAFEMPLILVVLAMMDVIDDAFLREKRRMAIFIMAIVSAIITPPDAVSMLSMMVPMILLYEISIFAVTRVVKNRAAGAVDSEREGAPS